MTRPKQRPQQVMYAQRDGADPFQIGTMMNQTQSIPAPGRDDLVGQKGDLAFYDRQSVVLAEPMPPLQAWQRIMAQPLPGLGLAFRLRDAISARFGVQRIGGFSGAVVLNPKVGDRLDFFRIERQDPDRLTLTARDTHLDVMICVTQTGRELAITASVVTHNLFGRAYMVPVAPAHRLIVRTMLRRLARAAG